MRGSNLDLTDGPNPYTAVITGLKQIGPDYPAGRAFHAAMAVRAWEAVINRTGISRYPIDKATVELEAGNELLTAADKAIDDEKQSPAEGDLIA